MGIMDLEWLSLGRVIARLPRKTLVKHTAPPYEYVLIPDGFFNSAVPRRGETIAYDRRMAKDGSKLSHLDKEG